MEIKDKIFNESIDAQTLEAWKKQYQVKEIAITLDNGKKAVGYFKRPDMEELLMVTKFLQEDPLRAQCVLYDACLLGGASVFNTDLSVKLTASGELFKDIKALSATSKNL